jgi:hypothetical protein
MKKIFEEAELALLRTELKKYHGAKAQVAKELGCDVVWVHKVLRGQVSGPAINKVLEKVMDVIEVRKQAASGSSDIAVKMKNRLAALVPQ